MPRHILDTWLIDIFLPLFSLFLFAESGCKSVKGTPYWMAPEVITATGHGRQADIWSVACTVIEMATGKPPWSQFGTQISAMFQIAKSKGPPTIPEHLSPDCKDFLYLCFNRNWRERPSATKLLQHPFLADVVYRTVAAPMNNIAAGIEQAQAQQIPAYRNPVPSAAPALAPREESNLGADRPSAAVHAAGSSSPQHHLAGNGATAHSSGPRRQLNLDRVAGANGATPQPQQQQQPGGYSQIYLQQQQQQRAAVMACAPVFADAKAQDTSFNGPPLVRSDGRIVTRPASTPRLNPSAAASGHARHPSMGMANNNNMNNSQQQQQQIDYMEPSAPLRRSGSSNISIEDHQQYSQQQLSQTEILRNSVGSTGGLSSGMPTAGDGGSLMETLALSGGSDTVLHGDCTYDGGNGVESSMYLRTSLASTAQNSEEATECGEYRSHASTCNGSEVSRRSEWNPMEEPAWMGGAGGAHAINNSSSSGMTNGSSGQMNIIPGVMNSRGVFFSSEEEATSIRPLMYRPGSGRSSDGASMPPPATHRSHGSTPFVPKVSSIDLSGHLTGRTGSGSSSKSAEQVLKPAAEGHVVYTMESELDEFDLQGDDLPWDIPAISSGGGGGGASGQLMGQSASLSAWRQQQQEVGSNGGRSEGSAQGYGSDQSLGEGGYDYIQRRDSPFDNATQDLIIEALLEQAQQDITASMAVFEASRRSSFGTATSSGTADSGNSLPATVANAPVSSATPSMMTLDLTEVISAAQQATSTATGSTKLNHLPSNNRSARSSPTKPTYSRQGPSPAVTPRNVSSLAPSRIGPSPAKILRSYSSGNLVPPSPSPAGSPSKRRPAQHAQQAGTAAGYASPTKQRYGASAGGSYEQQLKVQREARLTSAGSGSGYLARSAAGTPAKSAANHPLRTPRREYIDGRSASAVGAVGRTPARR